MTRAGVSVTMAAMAPKERLFLGLAYGPALDGVDAALLRLSGRKDNLRVREVLGKTTPLDEGLGEELTVGPGRPADAVYIQRLERSLGTCLARAAMQLLQSADLDAEEVVAIGLGPPPMGWLPGWGGRDGWWPGGGIAAHLARQTARPVVGGFAASEIAAGAAVGAAGAWADWVMFRDRRLSRATVNLGAVATVGFVGAGSHSDEAVSFPVGPGTAVLDRLAEQLLDREYDVDGSCASRGHLSRDMLELARPGDPVEAIQLDVDDEGEPRRRGGVGIVPASWLVQEARRCGVDGPGLLATAAELTADLVATAVLGLTERPHEVILSGGGAANIFLSMRIRERLCPCSTVTCEKFGVPVRAKMAAGWALLAAARVDGHPVHLVPRDNGHGSRAEAVVGALVLP